MKLEKLTCSTRQVAPLRQLEHEGLAYFRNNQQYYYRIRGDQSRYQRSAKQLRWTKRGGKVRLRESRHGDVRDGVRTH
jgi:hypothetical protein